MAADSAAQCSAKLKALNASSPAVDDDGNSYRPATVYYGSRVNDCQCYDSVNVDQAVAVFMLTRHQHDLFHLPHNMSLTEKEARALLRSDDGAPIGPMEDKGAGTNCSVSLPCKNSDYVM